MTDEIDLIIREQRALERDIETRKRLQEIGQELVEAARSQFASDDDSRPSLEDRVAALEARIVALENKDIMPAAAQPSGTASPSRE